MRRPHRTTPGPGTVRRANSGCKKHCPNIPGSAPADGDVREDWPGLKRPFTWSRQLTCYLSSGEHRLQMIPPSSLVLLFNGWPGRSSIARVSDGHSKLARASSLRVARLVSNVRAF
jgi:hypothetical protein